MMSGDSARPFGRLLTAMITPFTPDGELDVDGAQRLATYLIDEQRCDGLVLNGTTGEAPTTDDDEKARLTRAVVEAVGDRASILTGVSTYDTRHSLQLLAAAEQTGVDGLLAVTPYYSRPRPEMIRRHFETIADAASLPIMLYDIPPRAAVEIDMDTMCQLAQHPQIVAVKDATKDIYTAQRKRIATGLAYYGGVDEINLAAYASGQVGMVSVVSHLLGRQLTEMFDAIDAGKTAAAQELSDQLVPAVWGLQDSTQGLVAVKAALNARGLPAGAPRPPLYAADAKVEALIEAGMAESGLS